MSLTTSLLQLSDAVHSYWHHWSRSGWWRSRAGAELYRAATFSYDGTQDKGSIVQSITPNDLFYCVTKNVVDPKVNIDLWHLEIGELVQNAATWRFQDLLGFKPTTQETTLMCISNGLDAGLISNAVWKGLPLRDLLDQAGGFPAPRVSACKASTITPTRSRWRKRWNQQRCSLTR